MSSKLQSLSPLQLKVPRAQEFARARYEALEKQIADKFEKKQAERLIKVNEQKCLIEEAFDETPVSMEYVKVILPGFKTLFDEEIETELHNQGYCVDYSVQDDAPAQTTAWIYPELTEADYETIHNEVYRLETEIRAVIEQALRARAPTPEPVPRPLPNLDVIRQLIMQLQKYDDDDSDEDESECDCGCDHEEDSEDESESDSSEDESDDEEHICDDCYEEFYGKSEEALSADAHVELCHDCREELCSDLCNDCGLPRAPTPDLCDDCGKPQLE
jgi:hypothetical protein